MHVRSCQSQDDLIDAAQETVSWLDRGEIVGIRTDNGYVGLCRLDHSSDIPEHAELVLALRESSELEDFISGTDSQCERLLQRMDPGRVIVRFSRELPLWETLREDEWPFLASPFWDNHCKARPYIGVTIRSGELLPLVQQYAPWPLALVFPGNLGQDQELRGASDLGSLAKQLINCLNYGVDQPLPFASLAPAVVNFDLSGVQVIPSSDVSEQSVMQQGRAGILFVCTGNTCRSPMAEAICRRKMAEKLGCTEEELSQRGIEIGSAGVAADFGHPASAEAVELLAQDGIDLSSHISSPLSATLLDQADHVYTLAEHHRRFILSHRPDRESSVTLLSQDGQDVPDPIGGGLEVYRQCKESIEKHIERIVDQWVARLNSEDGG